VAFAVGGRAVNGAGHPGALTRRAISLLFVRTATVRRTSRPIGFTSSTTSCRRSGAEDRRYQTCQSRRGGDRHEHDRPEMSARDPLRTIRPQRYRLP
jgi:hypothetical protein